MRRGPTPAAHSASCRPSSVDAGPSTNGHSSSEILRQFAVAAMRLKIPYSPRLTRLMNTKVAPPVEVRDGLVVALREVYLP